MTEMPLLSELALIFPLSVLVTVILARFRLPTVAGFLFAGALAGPHGLGLVGSLEEIEQLAEIGVVLLLFTIGLEFSLDRLTFIFRNVAFGGLLQVVITTLVTTFVATKAGWTFPQGVLFGFVMALSSTAIVLRGLAERDELSAPHGRFIVGTLIFQDLCVVPMMLIIPLLARGGDLTAAFGEIVIALAQAALLVGLLLLAARTVIPRLFNWVETSRSRETFLLAVLAVCVSTAWLTSLVGLSLALGAFLGGMLVADTDFRHRALSDVLPLRDAFVSLFFVSLGMLFQPILLVERPWVVLLVLLGFTVVKGFLATLAAMAMRFPPRAAWLAGVGLAQFGEFGFVLVREGQRLGLMEARDGEALLAGGILSMFLTPIMIMVAPHVRAGERLLSPLARLLRVHGADEVERDYPHLSGHVLVIGFGLAGRLICASLKRRGIPYVVIELNVETVRSERQAGEPIYYGDASSAEALSHASVSRARAVMVIINDPRGSHRVVDAVQRAAPEIPIFTRTRYNAECASLVSAGASSVVAEEVEGGLELLSRLLRHLEIPRNLIEAEVHEGRTATQEGVRPITVPRRFLNEHEGLADLKIESVAITAACDALGRTAAEIGLRETTRALIVAIRRDGILLDHPDPHDPFREGDIVYLVGSLEAVLGAVKMLGPRVLSSTPGGEK